MIFNKICRGYAFRIAAEIKILVLILLIVLAGSASAITVTVDAGGGANYTNIQDAINATSDGDTIFVNSGTYQENVDVNKQLILKGMDTGQGKPVVNASGSGNAVTLSAGNSTLDGFTVTNGATTGIAIISDSNILSNNSAMNNTEDGIVLTNASSNTLDNNNASSNTIFGIALLDGSNLNVLSGNNISDNGNAGIFLRGSGSNILNNNTADLNSVQGIQLLDSIKNILVNNTVSNSDYGIYLESSSDDNILSSNTANMNRINGIFLTGSSNNTIYNNYFNNTNNFGVSGNNTWNTTITSGMNIINGPNIGGNYWANPNGTGFSQTCSDSNSDGICDSSYMLDSNNIDYLPLTPLNLTSIIITLADNGKNITLQVNESFLLKLGEDYDWNVTVDNQTVLGRVPNVLVIRGAQGIYKAHEPGNATLTAIGDPICRKEQPPCGAPSLLFELHVIVIASPVAGDLNGNGMSADAGDLVLMKRASIGEIQADSRYDLNSNGQFADAGDLVLMKRASIGEITFPVNMT